MTPDDGLSYPAPKESLLPTLRALITCTSSAERYGVAWLEAQGLTLSQFDVLVSLGDVPEGMMCKEIAAESLVSGPTLTPVLGRMESKGLVARQKCTEDARRTYVRLTPEGQARYEAVFLPHVRRMRQVLSALSQEEQRQLEGLLTKLRQAFEAAASEEGLPKAEGGPCGAKACEGAEAE